MITTHLVKRTIAVALATASLAVLPLLGCSKKTETVAFDSTVAPTPGATTPAANGADSAKLSARDSELNAPAKPEGMTGNLADSSTRSDTALSKTKHEKKRGKK